MRTLRAALLALVLLALVGVAQAQETSGGEFDEPGAYQLGFVVGGLDRMIHVYVPEGYDPETPMPMVLILHGAGGTGAGTAEFTDFNTLADREGFIAVYPQGYRGAWNDARPDAQVQRVNDVGFLNAIIRFLTERLSVDTSRIYAAGYSMGGMMAFRLGCQLPDTIAAVASVASTFPAYQLDACLFADPVPVLVIQGTDDDVIPIEGYRDPFGNRMMLSLDETMRYWSELNACDRSSQLSALPDADPDDETVVSRYRYANCADNAEVLIYLVRGGGHTWPGHPINAPFQLGATSMDFDASEAIWEFFESHPGEAVTEP